MARRCDRPGCSEPGVVAYGFDAVRRLVWLDTLFDDDRARSGALCARHGGRLTAPRGWWLDDRRIEVPELFHGASGADTAPEDAAAPEEPPEPVAPKRRRRRKSTTEHAAAADTSVVTAADASVVAVADQVLPENLVPFVFDAAEPAVVAEGVVIVDEVLVVEDDEEVVGGEVVLEGSVVVEDDASPLNPILEPSTPLLARAFIGTARTDRPHHRPRRAGPGDPPEPPH